jgi:6-pyruvoyltetrahydropterin/6-carboxytetrahydropterin synthase
MNWSGYYTISKEFHFAAAHHLDNLPPEHQCSRLHGHNYRVIVELGTERLNEAGFVLDYGDLKPFGTWIDENLDHQYLNDVLEFQTSAENMTVFLGKIFCSVIKLPKNVFLSMTVCETPKTSASFYFGVL